MIISHQYDGKMDQKLEQRRLWTGCCEGKLQFKEKQYRRPWDRTAVVRHTSYTWKVSFDSSDALRIFPEAAGLCLAFGSILIHQEWRLQTQNLADACGSFPFLSFKKNPSRKTHVKKTQRITPSQATYYVLAPPAEDWFNLALPARASGHQDAGSLTSPNKQNFV